MLKRNRVIAIAVLIFVGLVYLFAWSPIFTVKSINVIGLPPEISTHSIITRTGIFQGEKLARIEPRSIENKLSEISWLKSVSVDRQWAHSAVEIRVVARIPVGLYKGKAIDLQGAIFDLPGAIPQGLPVVSAATPELGLRAITLFTHLSSDIRANLISISTANESSISSWQKWEGRSIKVMWGSVDQVDLKVSVLKALLAQPENKSISRVDLSAPHAPIVK
jgi:cell division protein FtsQ